MIWKRGLPVIDVQKVDLGHGHTYLEMKCPGCKESLQINEGQRLGRISVDHDRKEDGCGFHYFIRDRQIERLFRIWLRGVRIG